MKIFAIFPDEAYMKNMSIHTMETPSNELTKLGVICSSQGEFFLSHYSSVKPEDIVIVWIGTRNESWLDMLSSLKCRKFLRNIDSCKVDKILFKREQEIFHRVGFEAMLVTYCTKDNKKFLLDRNIRSIDYPHFIDFSSYFTTPCKDKKYDILISGQMSNHSYPVRTRVAELLLKQGSKYKIAFLPHPGHSKQNARHPFYGENYIKLASNCRLGSVCTGGDDAMVMKYLEFAKAGALPIGDIPSNMPDSSKESMLSIKLEDSDEDIIRKIDEILLDHTKLDERVDSYRKGMNIFDIRESTKMVLYKIVEAKYDS